MAEAQSLVLRLSETSYEALPEESKEQEAR